MKKKEKSNFVLSNAFVELFQKEVKLAYQEYQDENISKVEHPKHYTQGKVECIDAIESCTKEMQGLDAICVANIIKYLWRFPFKHNDPKQDLLKAKWYLERLIDAQNKAKDKQED